MDSRCLQLFEEFQYLKGIVGKDRPCSLLGGGLGFGLLLVQKYRATNDVRLLGQIKEVVDFELSRINVSSLSFADGLSGLGWFIFFVKDLVSIDDKILNSFSKFDDLLIVNSLKELNAGEFDYLEGGLGPVIYLLERESTDKIRKYFNEVEEVLSDKAIKSGNGWFWLSAVEKDSDYIDLGMAHGIPSIINLLCLMQMKGVGSEVGLNLIREAVRWLISIQAEDSFFSFPHLIQEGTDITPSRLAWCYGDLSVAKGFYFAGKLLGDPLLLSKSYEVVKKTMDRQTGEDAGVADACFCHGTAGLAYLYYKFYLDFDDITFLKRAMYWYEYTWKYKEIDEGIAGFRLFIGDDDPAKYQWINSLGILDGSLGICQSLLTISSESDTSWDRCVLLS